MIKSPINKFKKKIEYLKTNALPVHEGCASLVKRRSQSYTEFYIKFVNMSHVHLFEAREASHYPFLI